MSVANLNTNLNGLMLDGVCERGAACPGQCDAAVPAVLNPKTQWQDGTRRLVMSPLKYMPGVAVEVPRQRRSPWPVARGPHKRLLRGGQYEAVSAAEGSAAPVDDRLLPGASPATTGLRRRIRQRVGHVPTPSGSCLPNRLRQQPALLLPLDQRYRSDSPRHVADIKYSKLKAG